MTVTSFWFFLLLLAGVTVYYICPGKVQWIILLCCSMIYYYYAAKNHSILFLIFSAVVAYIATICIEKNRASNRNEKVILIIALAAIILNVVIWFIIKGSSYWISISTCLNRYNPEIPILYSISSIAPLGMGYYTAQVIAYILDVYWQNIKAQRNPVKLFLFVSFFPQLTVGPISRYKDLETLFQSHNLSYKNISFGCQRIIWGLLKKIVISDRVGIIVNGIWSDTTTYNGLWIWVAVLLYPLQIYTDFSGCMDIVIGAAELFDIHLAENFRNPFFSRNSQEFWQRWHITLGTWARDFIYYPILKSKFFVKLGKRTKRKFGKRIGKFIPWSLGMAVLWFVMGFWHGSVQHIFGVSLWFWCVLILSELFEPIGSFLVKKLAIKTDVASWHLFQSLRTYIVYAIGAVAFSAAGFRAALGHYELLLTSFRSFNPWILFDGSITSLGVTWTDINIIVVGVLSLLLVAALREKYGYARVWIEQQNLVFRWLIWVMLFVIVLIYGLYGEGYDASIFIYEGF